MRKFISMLLIIAFALSFAACGQAEEAPASLQVPVDILGQSDLVLDLPPETNPADVPVEISEEQKAKLAAADTLVMENMVKCFWDITRNEEWLWELVDRQVRYNFSCYSDSTVDGNNRIEDYSPYWHYDSNSVMSNGEAYLPDGLMDGITVTFYPSKKGDVTVFKLDDVRVNEMVPGVYADPDSYSSVKLSDIHKDIPAFIRDAVGDEIVIQSPMYRNSCFTIFINNDSEDRVYGQWNGRNLPSMAEYHILDVQARLEANANSDQVLLSQDAMYMEDYVSGVKVALAREDVFNEMLNYVCTNNVSSYINLNDERALESQRIYFPDSTDEYMFDLSNADWNKVKGLAAGNMTGFTLTASVREKDGELGLFANDLVINKFIRDESLVAAGRQADTPRYLHGGTPDYEKHGYAHLTADGGYLYNYLRVVFGDYHRVRSGAFKNSEYTVFVRMTDDPEGLIEVYGQWNGINISN